MTVECTRRAHSVALGKLVLMRHAKSDYPSGVPDHDRPLNPRGRRDAAAAGIWLAEHWDDYLGTGAIVLLSSATRVQQTFELLAPSIPEAPIREVPELYEAAVSTIIAAVQEPVAHGQSVLVIAHNPGLEQLATFLTQTSTSWDRTRMLTKYPTSAIAVLGFNDEAWSNASAELIEFAIPRG